MNEVLKQLYDIAEGNLSKYIYLRDTNPDVIETLVGQSYIKSVQNSNKSPMYLITLKLLEAVAGKLNDNDLRVKQINNLQGDEHNN